MMRAEARQRVLLTALILVVTEAGATESGAAEFTPLGDLNGGSFNNTDDSVFESEAYDISADGSTVVGRSNVGDIDGYGYNEEAPDYEAFRWTENGGMQGLGDVDTHHYRDEFASAATAVSADGSVIAGHSLSYPREETIQGWTDPNQNVREVFRWTEGGGIDGKGTFEPDNFGGFQNSRVSGISGDGSVITTTDRDYTQHLDLLDYQDSSFRWTPESGIDGLGTALHGSEYHGSRRSAARDVSTDGNVIVGNSHSQDGNTEAFRWTEGGGMEGIGFLDPDRSGYAFSRANAASADGSVIVGPSLVGDLGSQPFRWTEETGMQDLGELDGEAFLGEAVDVSADGSVILGAGRKESMSALEPFLWDQAHGIRLLEDVLEDAGLELSGWSLDEVSALSADGLNIAGTGTNPDGNTEAFRATLDAQTVVPTPSALAMGAGLMGLGLLGGRRRADRKRAGI